MSELVEAFPKEFAPEFTVLTPDSGLGENAAAALDSLAEHGFVAALGVHRARLGDLAVMAAEPHIAEYCPNDGGEAGRFVSEQRVTEWLKKGRTMVGIYAPNGAPGAIDLRSVSGMGAEDVTQVAYGWLGYEPNKHIPGADITTAYRVGEQGRILARARRQDENDKFRLGLPLGWLVVGAAVFKSGAEVGMVSLENWKSNPAGALYEELGFKPVGPELKPESRPTLRKVGTKVNGATVFMDVASGVHRVMDTRVHQVLTHAA